MIERTEADTVTRRGRPKGSGIDDTATLHRVAALLSADRRLKPTTAIKQVGISDPSMVRRLREKLKGSPTPPPAPRAVPSQSAVTLAAGSKPSRRQLSANQTSKRAAAVAKPIAKVKSTRPAPDTLASMTAAKESNLPSPEEIAKRQRESAMLAAYLKAMIESAAKSPNLSPQPITNAAPAPNEAKSTSSTAHKPEQASHGSAGPTGFQFPGFPPFMQPFLPKPQPTAPAVQKQMDGLKLSVEAMTALARLQLHFYENALSASPLGFMLQGQTMMGQMMLAAFTGRGVPPKKPDPDKK